MRILIVKSTKQIVFSSTAATEGTLLQNAINIGYSKDDVEERFVTLQEYEVAKSEDPVYHAQVQAEVDAKSAEAAKQQAFIDNLPTWQQVSDAIDGVNTIAGLKVVVKKLARVVYWLARNSLS